MRTFNFNSSGSYYYFRKMLLFVPAIALMLFGLQSCWKDRFDFSRLSPPEQWNPDISAPLIHSSFSLKDLLNDYDRNNLFVEDATNFLYLVYRNKVFSQTAADFLIIPDQEFDTDIEIDIPGFTHLNGDFTAPPYRTGFSFSMPHGEVIDKILLRENSGGSLIFSMYSPTLNHRASIQLSIPSARRNGTPLSRVIDYDGGYVLHDSVNLSGYEITFNNTFPHENRLEIVFTVTLHGSGDPNLSPYIFETGVKFSRLSFRRISGDFKQQAFSVPTDSVLIRIFENNVYGIVNLADPRIHVHASNSMGIPLGLNFSTLQAVSPQNPPYTVAITGYPNPWIIQAPANAESGQIYHSGFTLDNSSSGGSLTAAVNLSPQWFIAGLTGQTNPAGGTSSNFIMDTSRLGLEVQIELPMYGSAWNFLVADTFDFEFDRSSDQIESILFRINTSNRFPIEARLQIYFLDAQDDLLDSLIATNDQLIVAAPTGPAPDYRVIAPAEKLTYAELTSQRLQALRHTRKLVVSASMSTANGGSNIVKFYSDYTLDIRLATRTKFNIPL
jgi:hypothetical protein